ncbi:MAG TPA: GNAT family N-acetyltransferase [Paucimonas sp.]|nr:GNAT family N-acetyltransferase [Paucimonas sp.]
MNTIEFERLESATISAEQLAALARVVLAAPAYSMTVKGRLPSLDEVPEMLADLPPGYALSEKFFYGIHADGKMIGCADILRGWKHARQSMVGLLLFDETFQGRGFGTLACRKIEEIVRSWQGMESIRIGVNESNTKGFAFWRKMGFKETGERSSLPDYISDTIILEKPLW